MLLECLAPGPVDPDAIIAGAGEVCCGDGLIV
jgi:hypothetical protein